MYFFNSFQIFSLVNLIVTLHKLVLLWKIFIFTNRCCWHRLRWDTPKTIPPYLKNCKSLKANFTTDVFVGCLVFSEKLFCRATVNSCFCKNLNRGEFRTLSVICDDTFLRKQFLRKTVNYFRRETSPWCLTGFYIHFCLGWTAKRKY